MLLMLMVTSKGMAGVPRASLVVIAATLSSSTFPKRTAADHRHRPVPRHGSVGDQRDRQLAGDGGGREMGGRKDGDARAGDGAQTATGLRSRSMPRPIAPRPWLMLLAAALIVFMPRAHAQEQERQPARSPAPSRRSTIEEPSYWAIARARFPSPT